MHTLYNIAIYIYSFLVRIASLFNEKARLWVNGRKNLLLHLNEWRQQNPGKLVWIHCASLGEFEQGRPVIESIKKEYPQIKILLTFFSPSGYEVRKNYTGADYVCYLPADTPANARRFVEIIKPEAALIIKYEYWANYFFQCKKQNVPLLIVSGILREDQRFFGMFSFFWKKVLNCVTHFFVQNEATENLLKQHGYTNLTKVGDTRFDRVITIASQAGEIAEISRFKGDSFCVIAGSSWPQEEKFLQAWLEENKAENNKLIIVPHEISRTHISAIQNLFPVSVKWSEREQKDIANYPVLIIDTIGLLSSIYRYADAAVIGGGFGKGIHNTLEAAVWGIPVLFGSNYQKFEEAKQLIEKGGAFSMHNEAELKTLLSKFKNEPSFRTNAGNKSKEYVMSNDGATQIVMDYLFKGDIL